VLGVLSEDVMRKRKRWYNVITGLFFVPCIVFVVWLYRENMPDPESTPLWIKIGITATACIYAPRVFSVYNYKIKTRWLLCTWIIIYYTILLGGLIVIWMGISY